MNTRRLGRTGISVSEIGYGAWGIGGTMWMGGEDSESLRALNRAVDLGLNFIDTALVYGDGHSEQLVGQVLKERRERIYVASKIPPKNNRWPALPGSTVTDTFPSAHIISSTEQSLRNLAVDCIDLQQFHVWQDAWTDSSEWSDALSWLKEQGKIHHVGISVNDHQSSNAIRAVKSGLIDTIQVIYNIFDQSAEEELFPACEKYDVGVLVRVPLDEGGLTGTITGDTTFPPHDFRNKYFRGDRKSQVYARTEALKLLLGAEASSLPELALRFCLQPKAVSTVIPGMRSVKNVEANCSISDGRRLSDELLAELRRHAWDRNFYSRA